MANPTVAEINAANAVATGGLSWAPFGTALPTDATTLLSGLASGAYKGLGYIGADGIQPARAITTDEIKDMNGKTVFTVQTDFSKTYQATLLQTTNVDVNAMIFGSAQVVATAADSTHGARLAVQDKGLLAAHGVLIIDTFSGLKKHREVIADAQVTSAEPGAYLATGVRQWTVTWTCFPDASVVYTYSYDDDGVTSP